MSRLRVLGFAIVFAMILTCASAFAQTGGLTGKCTGTGGTALAGYTVQIDRVGLKWSGHVKTNKKGEYTYIGLASGDYKVTLLGPDGKPLHNEEKHVGLGDPTEVNFDIAEAMKRAEKAMAADPEYQKQVAAQKESANLKQVFEQGRALYEQKHYTEAAAVFERALPLAKDRNVPIVLSQLADAWTRAADAETNPDTRKEDFAHALEWYNKVLAIAPNDASIHDNLGHLYGEMGRSDDAIAEYNKAVELDPNHATTYYHNLGVILYNKGQLDAAAVALKKATDSDPTNANAWYLYGMSLLGKATTKPDGSILPFPGTVEAFQTYLKLEPTGSHAAEAQSSIEYLSAKTTMEYKKKK